ncbi:hypothetical protein A7982_13448 [Minicystis rosea]|nr:hypothetical protein A7982_13448 [Minicystis rosea]
MWLLVDPREDASPGRASTGTSNEAAADEVSDLPVPLRGPIGYRSRR